MLFRSPNRPWPSSHQTEDFSDLIKETMENKAGVSCRRIESYVTHIQENEYRVAEDFLIT